MCNFMMIFLKLRELQEKEYKYINCSKFPWHMVCTKPGSEGLKPITTNKSSIPPPPIVVLELFQLMCYAVLACMCRHSCVHKCMCVIQVLPVKLLVICLSGTVSLAKLGH